MTETAPGLGEFDFAGDDQVVPFQVEGLDVRGRAVQLGPMLDAILERHSYPLPVARLVAETVVLTVLLGTSLKFEGKLIVQTQGDGPVDLVVADFSTPDRVRAYARYDEDALAAAEKSGRAQPHELLGNGVLAFTIDQGAHTQRYQGVVALDGATLEEIAGAYFRQSEQIPTRVRLAVAELLDKDENGKPRHRWRAGGMSRMIRRLHLSPNTSSERLIGQPERWSSVISISAKRERSIRSKTACIIAPVKLACNCFHFTISFWARRRRSCPIHSSARC